MDANPPAPVPRRGEPTNIRFPAKLAEGAKRAAARDGASSVSEWIRRMVEQEVRRRDGRCPACGGNPSESAPPQHEET